MDSNAIVWSLVADLWTRHDMRMTHYAELLIYKYVLRKLNNASSYLYASTAEAWSELPFIIFNNGIISVVNWEKNNREVCL